MQLRNAIWLAIVLPVLASQAQQTRPALQIAVPTTGTVVSPGQTLSVSVTSPAGLAFSQLLVIGENPIGMSTVATSVPTQVSVVIPSAIACGPHCSPPKVQRPLGRTPNRLRL